RVAAPVAIPVRQARALPASPDWLPVPARDRLADLVGSARRQRRARPGWRAVAAPQRRAYPRTRREDSWTGPRAKVASEPGPALRGRWRLAVALAPLLVELLADALALQFGEVVHEQFAGEVIHLMLDAHTQQAVEIALVRGAFGILVAQAHAFGARHIVVDARHRQAAFFAGGLALARQDFRVDEHLRLVLLLGNVDHVELVMPVHLGRRKPDARRRIH